LTGVPEVCLSQPARTSEDSTRGDGDQFHRREGLRRFGESLGPARASHYFFGFCDWMSARRLSISFIRSTSCSSTFLRSLLETMLRLAASLTTFAGRVSSRVMRPWSLKELR